MKEIRLTIPTSECGRYVSVADHLTAIEEAKKEGIAEGRRLEREEVRCASCKYFMKGETYRAGFGECVEYKNRKTDFIVTSEKFGCIHHERRKG